MNLELLKTNNSPFTNILKKSKEFREKKAELDKILKTLQNISKEITEDNLKALTYEDLKFLKSEVEDFLEKDTLVLLNKIIEDKKREIYPELNKAIYYTELNKLENTSKLTVNDIKKIDNLFKKAYDLRKNFSLSEGNIYTLLDNKEKSNDIINFIKNSDIGKIEYKFVCGCDCEYCNPTIVSSEDFDKHYYMWEIEEKYKDIYGTKEFYNTPEYELYSDYESEGFGIITTNCLEGWGYDILNIKDYKKSYSKILLKITKAPDLTLENI